MINIKNYKEFLEDARMGDNSKIIGDPNSDLFQLFKIGQDSSFNLDTNLINFIKPLNLKIKWYDDIDHSITYRIMNRSKSFKSISEFNDYIIEKSPTIIDKINIITKSGKYAFFDKTYNITFIIYLNKNNTNLIKIISLINGFNDRDTQDSFLL